MIAKSACRTAFVSFATPASVPLQLAGRLTLPDSVGRAGAAVLICHGSDGVDGRGEFHADALNASGIATLEVDMWSARGSVRGAAARPATPLATMTDAFGALQFLRDQPEIDPAQIGIMGFSWGGVVTLLATSRARTEDLAGDGPGFAAHAALYPVCWAYGRVPGLSLNGRTGAPILLLTGDADAYDTPDAGERLAAALRSDGEAGEILSETFAGATHGFDRDLPMQVIQDPFAHEGRGGPVTMAFHPQAAAAARRSVAAFFVRTLVPTGAGPPKAP